LEKAKTIFKKRPFELLLELFEPKYKPNELQTYLLDYFHDTKLSELIKPCLITSYDITLRKAVLFTSADAKDPIWDFLLRDVARATSAAPSYFPPALISSQFGKKYSLIDGGVYANNPALCAYAEARKTPFSKIEGDLPDYPSAKNMMILSIGTGSVKKQYHYQNFKNAGEIKWLQPVIDILMSANSETVDYQLTKMYETLTSPDDKDYYRIEPSLFEASSEMDQVDDENLENLRQAGLNYVSANEKLFEEIVQKIVSYC
jgi:patatin-like phospholipase/acyl hydrolase